MEQILYTKPSKHHKAPFGFSVKVMGDNDTFEFWVQTSKDEDEPDWKPSIDLLSELFKKDFEDPNFIKLVLLMLNSH